LAIIDQSYNINFPQRLRYKALCETYLHLMKKIFYLTISLYLFSLIDNHTFSQTIPKVALRTDLISPSPNAVALGKFGIIPVSLYTGVPDINIPLGVAEGRTLKVPISLSYHHNGLKTYEEASWVGLGWTLNVGGVITRIVKDKLDETTQSDFKYENNISKYYLGNVSQDYLDGAAFKGYYDTEPDLFAFNFDGFSGKFMLYKGKIYQFPYQKLKITGSPSGGFSITTPDGNAYVFTDTELTRPKMAETSYSVPDHTSSWFLSRIVSADQKETIRFNYKSSASPVPTHSGASQSYQKLVAGNGASILSSKSVPLPSYVYTKRLESITTAKMTVSFIEQNSTRTDIANTEYALDKIIISSPAATIKAYKLNYGYFGTGTGIRTTLKLNSLDELVTSGSSNHVKTHSFLYESDSGWSVQSDDVDHWGYANGVSGGSIIIPNTIYDYGMNREPSAAASQQGMLKQIVYPTGGSTFFKFEQNIVSTYPHKFKVIPRTFSNYLNRLSSGSSLLTHNASFLLDSAQTVRITFSRSPIEAVGTTSPNGPDDPTKNTEPEITITPVFARAAAAARTSESSSAVSTSPLSYKILYNRDNGGVTVTPTLAAGYYQITLLCDSKESGTAYSIGYVEQTNIPIEGTAGPGLRVKEIASYPTTSESGNPLLKKTYSYIDAGGFSTGKLLKGANYGGTEFQILKGTDVTQYQLYSSVINSALGDLLDQEMYYSLVNEYQVAPEFNLRTQHEFSNVSGGTTYVNGLGTYLTRKTDYKKSDTGYDIVRSHTYDYKQATLDTSFSALKPYQTVQKVATAGGSFTLPEREYGYNWYSLTPGLWNYLASETETTYFGATSTVSKTTYVNDIKKNFNLSAVKKIDSRGYENIIKYKYPTDYSSAISQPFLNANVLSPVLEQQSWLKRSTTDSTLTGGNIEEFDPLLFRPIASYALETTSPLVGPNQESKNSSDQYTTLISDNRYQKKVLSDYDSSTGNLIAQDLLSRTTTKQVSYIWGYQNSGSVKLYPIAECSNGAANEFFYTGFEDGGTGVLTGASHTGINFYNGNYQLNFTTPGTGTYLYSYWFRSGDVWVYSGELTYTGPVTLTGEAFDDVRVFPSNGQIKTYTYLPGVGLSSTTDAKGYTTFFEYDEFQQLKAVKDQNNNLLKTYQYHYSTQ